MKKGGPKAKMGEKRRRKSVPEQHRGKKEITEGIALSAGS